MRQSIVSILVVTTIFVPANFDSTKVEICHFPPGNSGNPQTLIIDESALVDHEAHGDTIGTCAVQTAVEYSCQVLSAGPFTRLFVRPGSSGRMNGSPEDPFDSITAAMKYAARKDLPGVELQLASGVYDGENIHISRDTRIIGPGSASESPVELALSFVNNGEHTLGVQGIVFSASSTSHSTSIAVGNDGAGTALCDVLFDSVENHAISQAGGWLKIVDVSIQSTHTLPETSADNFISGTAIHLSGGVKAVLKHVQVEGTEGSGLIAEGSDTKVLVSYSLDGDGNLKRSVFNGSTGCYGAILIRDGALFLGEAMNLGGVEGIPLLEADANLSRGLTVLDGAQAHVRDIFLSNTRKDDSATDRCGSPLATIGATVSSASLVLTNFILTDSDLVGASIVQGGLATFYGTAENPSIVRNNRIGVNVRGTDLDLECLQNHTVWINNDINIDTDIIQLPPPICYDDEGRIVDCPPEPPPICVEVEFDPYWDTESGL